MKDRERQDILSSSANANRGRRRLEVPVSPLLGGVEATGSGDGLVPVLPHGSKEKPNRLPLSFGVRKLINLRREQNRACVLFFIAKLIYSWFLFERALGFFYSKYLAALTIAQQLAHHHN